MAEGLMAVVVTGKERFVQKRDERLVPDDIKFST
jgi:hypothetical protein